MKCKDCTDMICGHRTSDAEMECYYSQYAQPSSSTSKENDRLRDKLRRIQAIIDE